MGQAKMSIKEIVIKQKKYFGEEGDLYWEKI